MQEETCPLQETTKKCAIIGSDLLESLGVNVPEPASLSDVLKLVDMSDSILYSQGSTMRGMKKTMAVNISNSGSWLRLNLSEIGSSDIHKVLHALNCK